jgi:hypothetical protein
MWGQRVREELQYNEAPTERGAKESIWNNLRSILVAATNLLEKVSGWNVLTRSLAFINLGFVA